MFQIRTSSIFPEYLVPIDVIGISDGIDPAQLEVLSIAIPSKYNFALVPSKLKATCCHVFATLTFAFILLFI